MATETIKLAVDNSAALRGINQVVNGVEGLNTRLANLRNVLGGIAIGTFITNLVNSAKAITDLSGVTGIATERILGLRLAFEANGAAAEDADKALLKLLQSVGEAAEGSAALQYAFGEVGVSLQDLATLSEEDIFLKVIDGLSKIEDRSRRASLSQTLLGKSLRTADYAGVSRDLGRFTEQSRGAAQGIDSLDRASKTIEQAVNNLQIALFKILQPIAEFIADIDLAAENTKRWINAIQSAIIALVTFFTLVVPVGRALKALFEFFKNWRTIAQFGTTFREFFKSIRNGGDDIKTAQKNLEDLKKAGIDVTREQAGIDKYSAAWTKLRDAARSAGQWLAAAVGIGGAGIAGYTRDIEQAAKGVQAIVSGETQAAPPGFANVRDYLMREKYTRNVERANISLEESILKVTDSYQEQIAEIQKLINLDTVYLGMSENQVEIERAVADVIERNADAIRALREQKAKLTPEQRALNSVIDQQIKILENSLEADKALTIQAITNLQNRRLEQEKLLRTTEQFKQTLEDDLALQQLSDQIALIGLMGDELEDAQLILEVSQELERKLLDLRIEELDLLARKRQLTEEQFQMELDHINQLRQAASEYANERLEKEREVLEAQRKAQEDWQGALKQQLEELAESVGPAQVAVDLFGSVIGSIDRALTDFVEKGKFSFKEFARSIIRDMALIVARALIMRAVLAAVGMIFPGAATGLTALMNAAPRRFGGQVDPGNPYLVGEAGPELFMPKSAGTIVPNNQLMQAAPTQVVYQIQAVDAASFRSLVARDPSFIYNVTEVGRRSSPARRLG